MGVAQNISSRISKFFKNDKEQANLQLTKGATADRLDGSALDVLTGQGYDALSQYLRLDQDLLSRYADYEDMDEYGEIATALDIFADDATQPDSTQNKTIWVTSKDKTLQQNLDDLFNRTLRLDEELCEITRTLCISEGQRVWTARGPVPIEEVQAGELVQGWKEGKPSLFRVKARYDNGSKDVWVVKTKHRELHVTLDHPLLVQRPDGTTKWVKAGDLLIRRFPVGSVDYSQTDKLVCSTRAPEPPEVPVWSVLLEGADLDGLRGDKGSPAELLLPERITEGMCRLLGFLWGDGFMGSTDVASTSTTVCYARGVYPELNDLYDGLLRELGLTPNVHAEAQRTDIHSVRFKRLLLALGWKNGADQKRLPKWVGQLPWAYRKAFLDGFIDADGWVANQKSWTRPALNFEIANIPLATDLKNLVDGLGFRSGLVRTRHRPPGKTIKGRVVKSTKPTGTLTYSEYQYAEGFMAEAVLSVEKLGEKRVYDLEVEDDAHNFVVEGVVAHNCKYGNNFEELVVNKEGVRGFNYLPPATMRRIEGNRGDLLGFIQDFKGQFDYSPTDYQQVLTAKFADSVYQPDIDLLQSPLTAFEPWEVIHWRLRGRERRSLYGHSVLEAARWIYKRLMLLEDAALVYRLQRAPERFAFYVDTGDLPPKEALAFLNRVRQNFRKKKFVDPTSGKLNLKFETLAQDEDFFIPTRKGVDSTRIETLGAPQWQAMDDIEYFRDKLFAAIKVPKAYLGQEQGVARAVLSSEDVRFARTVLRIQRELKNGLRKVVRVHLAALDIDPYAVDYDIHMTVPSSIFELAQMEVRTAKADLAARMRDFVSMHWILSHIFGMSDEDIKLIQKQRRGEAIDDAKTQGDAQQAAMPPEAMMPPEGAEPPPEEAPPEETPAEEPEGAYGPPQEQRRVRSVFQKNLMEQKLWAKRDRAFKRGIPTANSISDRELFEGKSNRDQERRLEEKFQKLIQNDKGMELRLRELGGLLRDIRHMSNRK